MVARMAWAVTIKRKIDPDTKKEYPLDIKYEACVNPKPLLFPVEIVCRFEERLELVRKAVEEGLKSDPLL